MCLFLVYLIIGIGLYITHSYIMLIERLFIRNYLQSPSASRIILARSNFYMNFLNPKKVLWRLINAAHLVIANYDLQPTIKKEYIENETETAMWKVTLNMSWPENFQVEGTATKKAEAENLSFLYACHKMKNYKLLNSRNEPLIPDKSLAFNEKILKSAKSDLLNLFEKIWMRYGRRDYKPQFNALKLEGIIGKESYWKTELTLAFPETKVFNGYSSRRRDADSIAAAKALLWLREQGVINKKNRLIYSTEEDLKVLKYNAEPYSVCIPDLLQEEIEATMKNFNVPVKNDLCSSTSSIEDVGERMEDDMRMNEADVQMSEADVQLNEADVHCIITHRKYRGETDNYSAIRNQELFDKNVALSNSCDPNLLEIREAVSLLPIASKKEDILRCLEENQVVVLSGNTGCGKTTQVSQFILDHYIERKEGAQCNIVVTQPRRISAISIAERVAAERGENVGDTVGYQVRLNRNSPKGNGCIFYCTTGTLLRKLCSNSTLQGVSHVIVDEVHERNIYIDFLLILLKIILESNQHIKILLMSATFNTSMFSQYFDNCPVIHVPGKVYPVEEYFLEDLTSLSSKKRLTKEVPFLDSDLIVDTIKHIDSTFGPGGVLCFLPGWSDILAVKNKLMSESSAESKWMIRCAHSKLPHSEQSAIFQSAPPDARKIILSTDIAETSITINDIVYVVNSGLHKGMTFDENLGVASLGTNWITKANVRQRRGRAGRVQPGVCYHLFTRKIFKEMDDYIKPELQRTPLESVILNCKLYSPHTKAEDFLSQALQPPSRAAIQLGVTELQAIGVLDGENLTELGKVVIQFATHPRLSVALVYAAFLGCLDPILTICAVLTLGKEPFENTLEDKYRIKKIKQKFDNNLYSDHLAFSKLFNSWIQLSEPAEIEAFLKDNLLDEQNLQTIKGLKALFAEDLFNTGIIDSNEAYCDPDNKCNLNSNHSPSVFAALSVAFYPNVIKMTHGEASQSSRLNKEAVTYSLIKGQRGYIQKESVSFNEHELPSPWLVYFSALQSEARRLMMTSSVSPVPGVGLLLLAGQKLCPLEDDFLDKQTNETVTLVLDENKKLSFTCSRKEAVLLLKCRHHFKNLFQTYVRSLKSVHTSGEVTKEAADAMMEQFLPVLRNILSTPHVPFTKGQFYKFVNNSLISEDL